MPRPTDVTDEDIQQWEEERQEWIRTHGTGLHREIPKTVWYAGEWLGRQLAALNCTKELARQIEQATGQKQAYSTDHWQTAMETVENYKKGIWDLPGEELAMRLMKERFGPNPDPMEVLRSTLDEGVDPEKLLELAMQHKLRNIIRMKKPEK